MEEIKETSDETNKVIPEEPSQQSVEKAQDTDVSSQNTSPEEIKTVSESVIEEISLQKDCVDNVPSEAIGEPCPDVAKTVTAKVKHENKKLQKKKKENLPIKGKPKSGRVWKSEKKKFSLIVKTKGIRRSFEKKQALREELKKIKELSNALKEAKKEQKEQKKQRRRDNIKRREENQRKSEIVQVITNTAKIKRMKKKQLRYIEKRDTNKNVNK